MKARIAMGDEPEVDEERCRKVQAHLRGLKFTGMRVLVPYADKIVFEARAYARRDFQKMIDLICVIAIFRQCLKTVLIDDRGNSFINADLEDYEIAYPLLKHAFQAMNDDGEGVVVNYYEMILKNFGANSVEFTTTDFKSMTVLGKTRAAGIMKTMKKNGMVEVVKKNKGVSAAIYRINKDYTPESNTLISPAKLREALGKS